MYADVADVKKIEKHIDEFHLIEGTNRKGTLSGQHANSLIKRKAAHYHNIIYIYIFPWWSFLMLLPCVFTFKESFSFTPKTQNRNKYSTAKSLFARGGVLGWLFANYKG